MNVSVVAVLTLVLAVPAVLGLAEGSIDPDEVGLRVLLAIGVAVVAEAVLRRFIDALRGPAEEPAMVEVSASAGGRQGDPPTV